MVPAARGGLAVAVICSPLGKVSISWPFKLLLVTVAVRDWPVPRAGSGDSSLSCRLASGLEPPDSDLPSRVLMVVM